jgi:hypothetical protein
MLTRPPRKDRHGITAATLSVAIAAVSAPASASAQVAAPPPTAPGAPAATAAEVVRLPVFVHAMAGLWVPWPGTFDENHEGGAAFDLVGGVSLEPLVGQRLDAFLDVTLSAHQLEPRAVAGGDSGTIVTAGVLGMRIFLLQRSPFGEPYLLAGAGLVYESAERGPGHTPPQPSWISMVGAGWEVAIGSALRLGGRLTLTYLDEGGARLGWAAPSVTAGFQL